MRWGIRMRRAGHISLSCEMLELDKYETCKMWNDTVG